MARVNNLPVWAKILLGIPADQDVICPGYHADTKHDPKPESTSVEFQPGAASPSA